MKVFVLGDIMLDEYIYITPTKLSQEAPIAVGRYNRTIYVPGGAANAAANVAALGAESYLAGYIGKDESAETLKALMSHHLIQDCTIEAQSWDTIRKTRIVDESGHQFVRVDYENPEPLIHLESQEMLKNYIQTAALSADCLFISDYGKGTLTGLIEYAIAQFKQAFKFVVVNGKPENIALYGRANVITMNKSEWEQAYKVRHLEVAQPDDILKQFRILLPKSTLIMTCGSEPIIVCKDANTYSYPIRKVDVADVSGAGDTFASVIAVLTNADPDAIKQAIRAAGEVVGYKGTTVPKWRVI